MKAIKLILAFLLVAGGLVGVLMLVSGEDTSGRQEVAANNRVANYYDKFTRSWEDADDWDPDLFRRNCNDVSVLSAKYDVTQLHERNVNLAFQKVNTNLFDLWRSPGCTKPGVDRYIAAIDTITAYDSNMEHNDGVRKIRRVNSAFTDAHNFVNKGFGMRPNFNGNNSTWNSFDAYREQQIQKRNQIKSDSLYNRYLSRITYLKDGLNQVEDKLNDAEARFYTALSGEIQNYYMYIDYRYRTTDKLDEFRSCVARFESEARRSDPSLNALLNQFESTVNSH